MCIIIIDEVVSMPFNRGDQVRLISDRLQIGFITDGPNQVADTFQYKVRFDQGESWVLENDLELCINIDPDTLFKDKSFEGFNSFLRLVTFFRLTEPFSDTILTRFASKIDFLPYQWLPLIRMLNNDEQRILIADEVGLGKTIEAGIIMRELTARSGGLKRVLIIARNGELNRQWEGELRHRFNEDFEILSGQEFTNWLEKGNENKFWTPIHAIVGRHSLQRKPFLTTIRKICTIDGKGKDFSHPHIDIDLLIVDESHHMRNRKNLYESVNWLAKCSKSIVFLTATPIHLGNPDLYNQLKLLLPKRFAYEAFFKDELKVHQQVLKAIRQINAKDAAGFRQTLKILTHNNENCSDILQLLPEIEKPECRVLLRQKIETFSPLVNVINRTTRRNIPNFDWPQRNAITIKHDLTDGEYNFYSKLIEEHNQAILNGKPFGKTMALRLAATCMPVAKVLHNLIDEEDDECEDEAADERGERSFTDKQRLNFETLASQSDSRFEKMWEALENIWQKTPESKVIVFSFFVDVLDYLSTRLNNMGVKHLLIHGKNPNDRNERRRRYDSFRNNNEIKLLLSSEVGTEGLNLQIADTIVNYNLPWNPMVVEQRIGRIDRKGQKSKKIRIVNLFAKDTIEDKVIRKLLDRLDIFNSSIGDMEPILGGIEKVIIKEFLDPNLSEKEIAKRRDKLADQLANERSQRQILEVAAREQLIADLPYDPMEKAEEEGRYVEPEHIKSLIEGFVSKETPRSEIIQEGKIYQIKIRQDLFSVLTEGARKLQLSNLENANLQKALSLGKLKIAFNSDDEIGSEVELVGPGHWLVKIICYKLKTSEYSFHPVSALKLKSDLIPSGYYAYGLFVSRMKGIKERKQFVPIFVSLNSGEPIGLEISNKIMSALLKSGKQLNTDEIDEDLNLTKALQDLRDSFHSYHQKQFEDFKRETERFKRLRQQTEEKYANSEIEKIKETIDGLKTKEQRRILPALEQRIRNLEQRRDNEIASLSNIKPVRYSDEKGFGIVKIIN